MQSASTMTALPFASDHHGVTPLSTLSGDTATARDLLTAIRTLKQVEREQRPSTEQEQHVLSGFPGFGPVALVLFPDPVTGRYKSDAWNTLGEELRGKRPIIGVLSSSDEKREKREATSG